MADRFYSPQSGGARPGAGRPPKDDRKTKVGLALTPDQYDFVRRLGVEGDLTDSEVVRAIVAERMAAPDAPPPLEVLIRTVLAVVERKTGLELNASIAEDIAATLRAHKA